MTREVKKTIGTWRVLPVGPELGYASPTATRPRTESAFEFASLLLGCVLAVAVTIAAHRGFASWSSHDGDRLAIAALPLCVVGVGFGIVGAVRRSKRRLPGIFGIVVNIGVAAAVALMWFVTHVAA